MEKIRQIQAYLKENKLDAIMITHPINRRYLTQFTGSSGIVIITESKQLLITDFRYVEQAKEQASHYEIIIHEQPIHQEVAEQLKELTVSKLAFEQSALTYEQYMIYDEVIDAKLIPVKEVVEDLRLIKNDREINIMKQAARIADQAFEYILSIIKPGVTEREIANELEFFMRKQGATSSSFDIIVASGERSVLPHGVASNKTIESGELVTMDFGALYNGYCSDITRTVAVGPISEKLEKIYNTVLTAQKLGVDKIKAGMTGHEADATTRDYIVQQGYGAYFGHSTGHGLGMEVHEQPRLAKNSEQILKKGMVVTVEPGIYIPGVGGCRIEDDIVITDQGNERLTESNKQLIVL